MASDSVPSLAQSYLDKHLTSDHLVGLGPVLGSGPVGLYAAPSAMLDGSLFLTFDPTNYVDCRVIAQNVCADILSHNPELKPRVVMQDGRIQNWVEITDPQSGETIQIDATPWYGCLNPGLVGKESNEVCAIDASELKKNLGPILSVKRTDVGVITVTLAGYLPKAGIEAKLEDIKMLQDGGKFDYSNTPKPDYSFILSAIFRRGFLPADPEFGYNVYIDVPDAAKLQRCIQSATGIEDLVKAGAIEIGQMFSLTMKLPMPVEVMSLLKDSPEKSEVIEEIKRNLPGIMKLLEQARPTLHVYGKNDRVEVKDGRMDVRIDHDYKPPSGFSKDPSIFKDLIIPGAGMKADYTAFIKDLKFKMPDSGTTKPLCAPQKIGKQQE
jgi:hypothetical protein